MDVRVLLFGPAAAAIGAGDVSIAVNGAAPTAGDVLRALMSAEPRLGPFVAVGRLAVNHAFAPAGQVVRAGDEVALIALVSGG